MTKLPKDFKDQWVSALRSGKYQQGKGYLRLTDNRFCCLGVACDLLGVKWNKIEITPNEETTVTTYEDFYETDSAGSEELPRRADLPDEIWKALTSKMPMEGDYVGNNSWMDFLAKKNDAGWTFEQLADVIEREL